jgi:hypothetical protein
MLFYFISGVLTLQLYKNVAYFLLAILDRNGPACYLVYLSKAQIYIYTVSTI